MIKIDTLKNTQPIRRNNHYYDYYITWNSIKDLRYIKDYLKAKLGDIRYIQKYNFYARVRVDFQDQSLIDSIVIAAAQEDFINVSYSKEEDIFSIISLIIADNKIDN